MEGHQHTIKELEHWYKHTFHKAGKVIVCMDQGHDDEKVSHYITNVDKLIEALRLKYQQVKDYDCQNDIKIMINNLEMLKNHFTLDRELRSNKSLMSTSPRRSGGSMGSPMNRLGSGGLSRSPRSRISLPTYNNM